MISQEGKQPAPCGRTAPCPSASRSGTVFVEAFMARGPIVCQQCDKAEAFCACEKYCTICNGQEQVHLCVDGLYYCPDCREACDIALADSRVH